MLFTASYYAETAAALLSACSLVLSASQAGFFLLTFEFLSGLRFFSRRCLAQVFFRPAQLQAGFITGQFLSFRFCGYVALLFRRQFGFVLALLIDTA